MCHRKDFEQVTDAIKIILFLKPLHWKVVRGEQRTRFFEVFNIQIAVIRLLGEGNNSVTRH